MFGASITCKANSNPGFIFSSWSNSSLNSNTINPLKFISNKHGLEFTANFSPILSLDQYQSIIVAYLAILGPISTIISFNKFNNTIPSKKTF